MDSFDDSVTAWIGDLKDGQDTASQKIWERYFERLVRVASRQLGAAPRRIADEEDVAVSVFDTLCRGAAAGRFDKLQDRDDLWKLLTAIAGMKEDRFQITLQNRHLIVSGNRRHPLTPEQVTACHQLEIAKGEFRIHVQLPSSVNRDQVQATYHDGLLRIELPHMSPRHIPIINRHIEND